MAWPKSTQIRIVGITDDMHPCTFFIETLLLENWMIHLVCYPYYSCLCSFWPYHPYLLFL